MRKIIKIIFVFLFSSTMLYAQYDGNKVIAKIGDIEITAAEFKKRYEMVPHIGRHIKRREKQLKAETLYSIIAEKLWALEAEQLNFDTTDIMKYSYKAIENMYLRDALYSKEITENISINSDDYIEGRQRAAVTLNTNFIHSQSEEEIFIIHSKLLNGESFDSLLSLRPEAALQDTPYVVQFGKMTKVVEDSLYKLNVGEFSSPLKSPDGWYIFKILSIDPIVITNERQAKTLEKEINRVVKERNEDEVFQDYYRSFFAGRKVQSDGEIFWHLSNEIIKRLNQRRVDSKIAAGETVGLETGDFYKIEKAFTRDTLAMVFIKLDENPITLKQFLYEFAFEGFYTSSTDPNIIRGQLNSRVKRFIEHELLSEEAYSQDLDNLPDVKLDTKMWRDNYLATLYRKTLFDSSKVTDDEVYQFYQKKKSIKEPTTQVNIIEILTDSLEVVETVLKELEKGTDIRELARKYSKREWTKKSGGEFGFFQTTSYGEIGRIAGELKIGEVYGPLKVEEGYSIFKLIDKKESVHKISKEYDELKDELLRELKAEKISSKMINNTVRLANKYNITVDSNQLYKVPVTNYNMLVYRYMGFGGKILAVPLTPVFIEWVKEWEKSKSSLP